MTLIITAPKIVDGIWMTSIGCICGSIYPLFIKSRTTKRPRVKPAWSTKKMIERAMSARLQTATNTAAPTSDPIGNDQYHNGQRNAARSKRPAHSMAKATTTMVRNDATAATKATAFRTFVVT